MQQYLCVYDDFHCGILFFTWNGFLKHFQKMYARVRVQCFSMFKKHWKKCMERSIFPCFFIMYFSLDASMSVLGVDLFSYASYFFYLNLADLFSHFLMLQCIFLWFLCVFPSHISLLFFSLMFRSWNIL